MSLEGDSLSLNEDPATMSLESDHNTLVGVHNDLDEGNSKLKKRGQWSYRIADMGIIC